MLVGARDAGGARRAAAAQRVVAGRRRRGWRRLASHYTARRHVFLRRHGGTVVAMTHWGRRAIRRALLTWVHRGVDRISYAVVLARSVRRWEAAAAAHGWRAWQLFRHLEAAWRLREAHTRGVLHRTLSLLAWRRAARRRAEARARRRARAQGGGRAAPRTARVRVRRRRRRGAQSAAADRAAPRTRPGQPTRAAADVRGVGREHARCDAAQAAARVRAASTRLHSAERALASWRGHATWRRRRSRRLERGVAHWRLRAASRVVDVDRARRTTAAGGGGGARAQRAIAVAYAAWAARAAPCRPLRRSPSGGAAEAIDAYGAWALGAHEAARWRRLLRVAAPADRAARRVLVRWRPFALLGSLQRRADTHRRWRVLGAWHDAAVRCGGRVPPAEATRRALRWRGARPARRVRRARRCDGRAAQASARGRVAAPLERARRARSAPKARGAPRPRQATAAAHRSTPRRCRACGVGGGGGGTRAAAAAVDARPRRRCCAGDAGVGGAAHPTERGVAAVWPRRQPVGGGGDATGVASAGGRGDAPSAPSGVWRRGRVGAAYPRLAPRVAPLVGGGVVACRAAGDECKRASRRQ